MYGYKFKPHEPDHQIFGSKNEIGGNEINPSGDWTAWLPPQTEEQDEGVEPEDCVSEATLGVIEILARNLFNDTTVWSKRFLAWASGTGTSHGNDPMTVFNTLKNKGTVPESDWPNSTALTTWDSFYAPPLRTIQTEALEFIAEYAVDGEWVSADPISMMAALKYSPLTVAGFAWAQDSQGLYMTPEGAEPCHDFIVYGFVENVKWLVFDSYKNDLKQLEWNYQFSDVMRYSLTKNIGNTPAEIGAWARFKMWMEQILGVGEYSAARLGGKQRSPKWAQVRAQYLLKEPVCQVTGSKDNLEVHHIRPFHLHPDLELDDNNLITLTRNWKGVDIHLLWGHWDNFATKYNPNIRQEAIQWYRRFISKVENELL